MKKVKFIMILALLLAMLVVSCQKHGSPPPATIGPDAKLISLFFDDCWQNQYDVALPILLKNNFKATFGVITDRIGTGEAFWRYMDEKELRRLAGYGMDIASHTKTHPDLTANLTDEQLREEIIDSKKHLEKLDFEVRTFVYPYFKWNDAIVSYVKEAGYVCARAGGWGEAYDLRAIDHNARYHVDSTSITNQSLDQFKAVVAKASRHSVVSLNYHFISDTGPEETSTPVQNFNDQMRYLKEAGFTVVLLPNVIK